MNQMMLELDEGNWQRTYDYDRSVVTLADRHYSRQKVGTNRATRPGKNLVLRTGDGSACWASWFPKYRDDGQTAAAECTIFRNESDVSSVSLIRDAVEITFNEMPQDKDGILTYIDESKIKSNNAGYSYKLVGFKPTGYSKKSKLLRLEISRKDFMEYKKTQSIIDGQLRGLYEYLQGALLEVTNYFEVECDFINEWITEPIEGEASYEFTSKLSTLTQFESYFDWQESVAEILKAVVLYKTLFTNRKKLARRIDFTPDKLDVSNEMPVLDIVTFSEDAAVISILEEFYSGWIPSEELMVWTEWLQQVKGEVTAIVKGFIKNIGQ